jgi:hypothetical protein
VQWFLRSLLAKRYTAFNSIIYLGSLIAQRWHADCLPAIGTPFVNIDLGVFEENERFSGHDRTSTDMGGFMNWLVYGMVWIVGSMGLACLFGRIVQNEVLEYFRR